jgi:hypothetical protein
MTQLLEGIEAEALLQHLPSNVSTSLETLERAGKDWNAVGHLLASTPTDGVALTGTGQWTKDLWQAVKWEFRSFLCTDSETYAELRKHWDDLKRESPTLAVASLTSRIGSRIGVAGGVLAPLVTWLFVVARRTGRDALCATISSTPGIGSVRQRSAYA